MMNAFAQRSYMLHRQVMRSRLLSAKPVSSCSSSMVWKQSPVAIRFFASNDRIRRRKRPGFGVAKIEGNGPPRARPETTPGYQPHSFGDGESTDEYLKKTSLSPWVPLPDPIARKLFDSTMSNPTPEDIHVDLGCGDGRINFYAIDHGKVKKSTGIDVDDGILKQARERLRKRHPQPPIEFLTADLLDLNNKEVWDKIQEATIITMYFVGDALQSIRPLLEEKLVGKQCKIITCAYPMPGWNHTVFETTLGTTCYVYNWGSTDQHDEPLFTEDSLLDEKPKALTEDPFERFKGLDRNNIEHVTRRIPDRSEWDETIDGWSDDEEEDEDDSDDEDGEESDFEEKSRPSKPNKQS